MADAPEVEQMTKSSRDPEDLRARMERWLAGRLPADASPRVPSLSSPSGNGMSSETLLFEASWNENGVDCGGRFVARVEPSEADVPVFPEYDLELQYKVIDLVGRKSDVPVPGLRWLELDPSHLGGIFFVMDRIDGRVPPDVMPYTMGSWLFDASREEQRRLQDATVSCLARLHNMDLTGEDVSFLEIDAPGDTPLRRHFENQRKFYDWMRDDRRHPIIERTFEWMEANWPADEGETVVSWGDARIGNCLYDGFEPAGVLDWEMAALAPREVDLGWMIFIHVFFDDITTQMGMEGMKHFMRSDDVAATYAAEAGRPVRNLRFFEIYAALRHAIVMARVHARRVHFGEAEWGDDVDEPIMHRNVLAGMLEGRFYT